MNRWFLLLPVLAIAALFALAVWLDRDRLGLEHTLYLYRSLMDGR